MDSWLPAPSTHPAHHESAWILALCTVLPPLGLLIGLIHFLSHEPDHRSRSLACFTFALAGCLMWTFIGVALIFAISLREVNTTINSLSGGG